MKKLCITPLFLLPFFCFSQDSLQLASKEKELAILWHQQAAEYRALCLQSFNIAKTVLEQETKRKSKLPLAIITDIDETILDNSYQEAQAILDGKKYSKQRWKDWTDLAQASPVPGASEFLKWVERNKIEIFYISNRDTSEISSTISNLKAYQFPNADKAHLLFLSNTSSKESRRQTVLKDYKILLLLGDNLNDFAQVFEKKDSNIRKQQVDNLKEEWGKRFIVFPNAIYGEWENAIYEYKNDLSEKEKAFLRTQKLIGFPK